MNDIQSRFNNLVQQAMTEIKENHIDKATALVNQILNDSDIKQLAKDHPEVQKKLNNLSIGLKKLNQEFDENEKLPVDMVRKIMGYADKQTVGRMAQTSSKYMGESAEIVIKRMNESRISLKGMGFKSAEAAVDYIVHSGKGDQVKFLNFMDLGVTDDQLKLLSENCPNLQHLFVANSGISEDALACLKNFPDLRTLDISWCRSVGQDALKNLQFVPKLTALYITFCISLGEHELENLKHTPDLRVLEMGVCRQFSDDALKNLKHTPKLETLDINHCVTLRSDALDILEFIPKLQSLDISSCENLNVYALDNLEYTPDLKKLSKYNCPDFVESEDLKLRLEKVKVEDEFNRSN